MNVTISADVGEEDRVLLVPRHDGEYAKVGTVAEVSERVRLPGGVAAVSLVGLHRGIAGAAHTDAQGRLRVEVDERPDVEPPGVKTRELEREYRAVVEEILELRGDDGRISSFVRSIREVGMLADTAAYAPEITFEQRIELLEAVDVVERLELALRLQRERLAELQIRHRIREDVEEGAQRQQREYILRRQLESIRKELGEDDASVSEDYRGKIADADLPDEVREQADREIGRLERMGDQSGESSMIRTYLDWLLAVPWGKRSEERLDPVHARDVLDNDHAGLEDVKERIVEYLAVRKLRQERGIAEDKRSGAILSLIGPPATGKTSVGESIARATGREFVRMSLGGVRDEAEIRGHRRTYIGALPGRLVRALLDRMEVIRFDGYTVDEKVAIARGYLWPRQRERAGLLEDEVSIDDITLELIVSQYTREAGVRQLERELGKLLRKTATTVASGTAEPPITIDEAVVRDALGRQRFYQESAERTAVPGVATGLAVTGTGGDVLFVEATKMPGKDGLVLTGQLGDVMKESARIALSYVRSHADKLGLDENDFEDASFHVHVPAGAIPKDGPSAGITMTTALASLLTGRPVKHTAGLTDVIIPERNRADLDDIPEDVRNEMSFHPVMSLDEVLELSLEPHSAHALS